METGERELREIMLEHLEVTEKLLAFHIQHVKMVREELPRMRGQQLLRDLEDLGTSISQLRQRIQSAL